MAKDDPNNHADDPQQRDGEPDDVNPQEEDERVSDAGEKTLPDVLDSTIDSIGEAYPEDVNDADNLGDESDTGKKTVPDLLDSTIDAIEDVYADHDTPSPDPEQAGGAGEKTVADVLDSTIDSIKEPQSTASSGKVRPGTKYEQLEKPKLGGGNTNAFETIDPFGINAAEKTLDALGLDQTLEIKSPAGDRPAATGGHDVLQTQDTTIADFIAQTVELTEGSDDSTQQFAAQEHASPLQSPDVNRTINPRELSPQDAELWDSLAVSKSAHGQATKNVPAIERSFTETKLQIRPRHVVTPKQGPDTPSDYRLVRLLGKGGMGNVFVAKQESLDRMIAVKVIKPLDRKKRAKLEQSGKLHEVEADRRHQFLSEAVVTGDLDHPNIVPIYDIAVTPDESLFYAMKRVVGTPWSKVLSEKTLDENLDILLKVCDAVGFAHTRGVVHRDIKPENIMLGDFGIVMVMDWGLALAKPNFEKIGSIAHTAGLGGTPAFMAPEMATGPIEKISPASDVYLLVPPCSKSSPGHRPIKGKT